MKVCFVCVVFFVPVVIFMIFMLGCLSMTPLCFDEYQRTRVIYFTTKHEDFEHVPTIFRISLERDGCLFAWL